MSIESLSVEVAKNVVQFHGVSRNGAAVLMKRAVIGDQLISVIAQIEQWTVRIEACTGAFGRAHRFGAFGRQGQIISPQD